MMIVFGRDDEVASWAAERLNLKALGSLRKTFVRPYVAIGIENGKGYCGAYVLNQFTGPDIELTIAGRGAVSRTALSVIYDYVFNQLGCLRISATCRTDNTQAIRLAERLGFKREGMSRKKFGNSNAVLLGLLREEYRYGNGRR